MFIVNPDSRVNRDIPNMQAAFASARYQCRVVDQNTLPSPPDRFLNMEDGELLISVRSLNLSEAERIKKAYLEKYPSAKVRSLTGFLDIQCCYPFLEMEDNLPYTTEFSDEFPYPDYDLFDSSHIFKKRWASGDWGFPLMTSLGCPFQCIYCASRNRKYHTRSIDHCIGELKDALTKWKYRSFQVLDDCFNVHKDRVLEFCEKVKPLNKRWTCTNGLRADLFDEEIAKALKESGCAFVSFGIESIEPDILKFIKKGETIEQIESAVTIAGKYFEEVNGYFIIGLPGSSFEKDLKALEWAKKHRINAHFSYFVPAEKELPPDALFYGESAEPRSDSYSREDQKKLYELTKEMRAGSPSDAGLIKRGLRKIKRIITGR
jgi:radical SAM superfamily enzyme YgiQ (UPF0313 family)